MNFLLDNHCVFSYNKQAVKNISADVLELVDWPA